MFARVSAPLSVHASVLTQGVRRKVKYDESPMTKSPTERTVTVIPPTRARTSQRPCKRVLASSCRTLRTVVSVFAAPCVDADPRFIAVLCVPSSRAQRDQLTFDFHYTRHCPGVYILGFLIAPSRPEREAVRGNRRASLYGAHASRPSSRRKRSRLRRSRSMTLWLKR